MIDFKKLQDPEFRAELDKKIRADELKAETRQQNIKKAVLLFSSAEAFSRLNPKEQEFVDSCHRAVSSHRDLSEKQERWLYDLEKKEMAFTQNVLSVQENESNETANVLMQELSEELDILKNDFLKYKSNGSLGNASYQNLKLQIVVTVEAHRLQFATNVKSIYQDSALAKAMTTLESNFLRYSDGEAAINFQDVIANVGEVVSALEEFSVQENQVVGGTSVSNTDSTEIATFTAQSAIEYVESAILGQKKVIQNNRQFAVAKENFETVNLIASLLESARGQVLAKALWSLSSGNQTQGLDILQGYEVLMQEGAGNEHIDSDVWASLFDAHAGSIEDIRKEAKIPAESQVIQPNGEPSKQQRPGDDIYSP